MSAEHIETQLTRIYIAEFGKTDVTKGRIKAVLECIKTHFAAWLLCADASDGNGRPFGHMGDIRGSLADEQTSSCLLEMGVAVADVAFIRDWLATHPKSGDEGMHDSDLFETARTTAGTTPPNDDTPPIYEFVPVQGGGTGWLDLHGQFVDEYPGAIPPGSGYGYYLDFTTPMTYDQVLRFQGLFKEFKPRSHLIYKVEECEGAGAD